MITVYVSVDTGNVASQDETPGSCKRSFRAGWKRAQKSRHRKKRAGRDYSHEAIPAMGTPPESAPKEGQDLETGVAVTDQQIQSGFNYLSGWKLQTVTTG